MERRLAAHPSGRKRTVGGPFHEEVAIRLIPLVERTRTAREGEIIVALVDGADATLKRFYREGSMIRLQPSNTEMSPIYAPAANVSIQGKVLGVLRKYA